MHKIYAIRISFYLLSIHIDNLSPAKTRSNNEKENSTIKCTTIEFEDRHLNQQNLKSTQFRNNNKDDKLFTPEKINQQAYFYSFKKKDS